MQTLVTEMVRMVSTSYTGTRVVRMLLQFDESRLRGIHECISAIHVLVQRSRRSIHAQVLLMMRMLVVQRVSSRHFTAANAFLSEAFLETCRNKEV